MCSKAGLWTENFTAPSASTGSLKTTFPYRQGQPRTTRSAGASPCLWERTGRGRVQAAAHNRKHEAKVQTESGVTVKNPLPWPDFEGLLPESLLNDPSMKKWVENQKRSTLTPPAIPDGCRDSQRRALNKLIMRASEMKGDEKGELDTIHLDPMQYYLDLVASTGTAAVSGLRPFLGGVVAVRFKNRSGIVYDETLEPDVVLLPTKNDPLASEAALNSFLIRLGRALERSKNPAKRRPLWPLDWEKNVAPTTFLIVQGWCDRIIVDGQMWPPLCCLTAGALMELLSLSKSTQCKNTAAKEARTVEAELRRLGLVRIAKGKFKRVFLAKGGQHFLFA